MLWLINRTVFHPRGFALALHVDGAGEIVGWSLLGDGSEPWAMPDDVEDRLFQAAERTLGEARDPVCPHHETTRSYCLYHGWNDDPRCLAHPDQRP